MSNEIQTIENSLAVALKNKGITEEIWGALNESVFPGAEAQSILLAWDYCKARSLDILKKPVHIVPMNVKDAKTGRYGYRDVIMPGIAEARITAYRTGEYVGQEPAVFGEMVDLTFGNVKVKAPEFCTVTVYRLIRGEKAPFPHTEYFEEAAATKKDGGLNSMWNTRKRGQLSKCAEAGALRKAFPEELGGLNTAEGMEGREKQSDTEMRTVTKRAKVEPFKEPAQLEEKPAAKDEVKKEEPAKPFEVTIEAYKLLEGESKGKAWKVHCLTLTEGDKKVEAKTFSNTIGGIAEFNVGRRELVTLETTSKGIGILTLEILDGEMK